MAIARLLLVYAFAIPLIATYGITAIADEPDQPEIRLKQVVAYTSGVAFFEQAGEVEGNADLVLEFPAESMDDLLKTLVLLDLDGGKTATVTYENRDPVARSLGTLPFDLKPGASLGDLLGQFRGQQIVAANDLEGRIVSVETQTIRDSEQVRTLQLLLLQTGSGLVRLPLEEVTSIKLVDPQVQQRLERALELLAMQADSPAKRVTLQFRGEGQRRVRIGYVQEFPVWKVSYRLVTGDDGETLLQGWAMVENTTDQDWENVQLSLVSGQPFAFRMNLYEPLYVERPLVKPSAVTGLVPREYDQEQKPPRARPGGMGGGFGGGGFGGGAFGGGGGFGDSFGRDLSSEFNGDQQSSLGDRLTESQPSLATASEVGELFHYEIDTPVTLASENSAMLPIVNVKVKGEKLSLYDPIVNTKHPQHGVRLTNTTDLHLMRGPIAILEDGQYAGDSRMADTPPGTERLITYAMDPEVDVEVDQGPTESELVEAKLSNAIFDNAEQLTTKYQVQRFVTYKIHNRGIKNRLIVVQRDQQSGWRVVEPEGAKTTDHAVRFEVTAPAGEKVSLKVVEQQTIEKETNVRALSNQQLAKYLNSSLLDEQTKRVLETHRQRVIELAKIRQEVKSVEAELKRLGQEQERIGKSMDRLDRTSSLYQRFVEKLDALETKIEHERSRLGDLQKRMKEIDHNAVNDFNPFD